MPGSKGVWLMPATCSLVRRRPIQSEPPAARPGGTERMSGSGVGSHMMRAVRRLDQRLQLGVGGAHVGEFQRVGIADRGHGPQRAVVEAVEAGLVDVDHALAEAGRDLAQLEVPWRRRRACRAVMVTCGKVAASVRRVTSMRPPTRGGAQRLLLEVGLLHQPVRDAAHQLGLRPPPSMPRFHSHR
jgi:hypothetical protein